MDGLYETDVEQAAGSIIRQLSEGVERTPVALKRKAGVEVTYPAFCAALKMLVEAGFIVAIQERRADDKSIQNILYRIADNKE